MDNMVTFRIKKGVKVDPSIQASLAFSSQPSNSSVWMVPARTKYTINGWCPNPPSSILPLLSCKPQSLPPISPSQQVVSLQIYFFHCCKTSRSYLDALLLWQHRLRLKEKKKGKSFWLCLISTKTSFVAQRHTVMARLIHPWLSKEFSAPRANLPQLKSQSLAIAAEIVARIKKGREGCAQKQSVGAARMSNRLQTYRTYSD